MNSFSGSLIPVIAICSIEQASASAAWSLGAFSKTQQEPQTNVVAYNFLKPDREQEDHLEILNTKIRAAQKGKIEENRKLINEVVARIEAMKKDDAANAALEERARIQKQAHEAENKRVALGNHNELMEGYQEHHDKQMAYLDWKKQKGEETTRRIEARNTESFQFPPNSGDNYVGEWVTVDVQTVALPVAQRSALMEAMKDIVGRLTIPALADEHHILHQHGGKTITKIGGQSVECFEDVTAELADKTINVVRCPVDKTFNAEDEDGPLTVKAGLDESHPLAKSGGQTVFIVADGRFFRTYAEVSADFIYGDYHLYFTDTAMAIQTFDIDFGRLEPGGVGTITHSIDHESLKSYYGHLERAKPHGPGIMEYKNGDRYVGSWEEGKRVGNGCLFDAQGVQGSLGAAVYEGQWLNDQKHGPGSQFLSNNDFSIGQFEFGSYVGGAQGVYHYADGQYSEWRGPWQGNKKHGNGVLMYRDGGDWTGTVNASGNPTGQRNNWDGTKVPA